MTAFSSSGGQQSVNITPQLLSPEIVTLELVINNTEYELAVPDGTRRFTLRARTQAELRIAYVAGLVTSVDYSTLRPGCSLTETDVDISSMFILSPLSSTVVVEVVFWKE